MDARTDSDALTYESTDGFKAIGCSATRARRLARLARTAHTARPARLPWRAAAALLVAGSAACGTVMATQPDAPASPAMPLATIRPATPAMAAAVEAHLAADPQLGPLALKVDAQDGHLVLHGATPDTQTRNRAGDLARSAAGGAAVFNDLSVQPPPAAPTQAHTPAKAPTN